MNSIDRRLTVACTAIAFASCLAWALLTPAFQAPDEPTHVAYVQRLAETGIPARPDGRPSLSSQGQAALTATNFGNIIGNLLGKPPWTAAGVAAARRQLEAPASASDGGGNSGADSHPPLYYALQVIPYTIAQQAGANALGELTAMRLLSSVLSALTVLFVLLFLRELLPRGPREAWYAGALAVGLLPLFGFIGSSVNDDVGLFACSAALFAALARSFRCGLTTRRALLIGAALVCGLLTKPTFLGLVPGALLGLLLLARRARGDGSLLAWRPLAAAAALVAAPFALYAGVNHLVWHRQTSGAVDQVGTGAVAADRVYSISGLLSYIFQFYLPRPSFLQDQVSGVYPLWQTWFKGFFGRFGWLDYSFPIWVFNAILVVWVALLALVGRALAVGRRALSARSGEMLTYVLMLAGLLTVIARIGYDYRLATNGFFEQARYLMPLLALYGALVALAIRGSGRRAGPYLAVAVVLLTAWLDVGGLFLTAERYFAP